MKEFYLKKLFLIHGIVALMLLISIITSCVLASINFSSVIDTFQVAWKPSLFSMFLALIVFILSMLRIRLAFILGPILSINLLGVFSLFLQLPSWRFSLDPHSFATISFAGELTAIFNLVFLITSFIGMYLLIKKYFHKKHR